MARLNTPSLRYYVLDESGEPKKFTSIEQAVAFASKSALNTEKTVSVFVYHKDDRYNIDEPTGVLNVRVTYADWRQ
jgi:hypothetical protein